MIQKNHIAELQSWIYHNSVAIVLALIFFLLYILLPGTEDTFVSFGATSIQYLNGEYYRWLTCLFLHYNLRHLLANSIGILAVASLLSPFLKKRQILFIFLSGGILAEIAFSIVVSDLIYDIGASSGIFALIACLTVCILRFPKQFHFIWYRPDVIITIVYFLFANTSVSAFLVHSFGFAAGIIISFILVMTGRIETADTSSKSTFL
ncbi:MAG: rhomboid family intramembrane serine protease [Lachnospiraceae bacterium]|nr:rhomboid family intramembrane serine protease [Lachnospiraceae bacterium]